MAMPVDMISVPNPIINPVALHITDLQSDIHSSSNHTHIDVVISTDSQVSETTLAESDEKHIVDHTIHTSPDSFKKCDTDI